MPGPIQQSKRAAGPCARPAEPGDGRRGGPGRGQQGLSLAADLVDGGPAPGQAALRWTVAARTAWRVDPAALDPRRLIFRGTSQRLTPSSAPERRLIGLEAALSRLRRER